MLPDFTEKGLLPAGIHGTTTEEFEQRFVYLDRSDRRYRLFDKLRELYRQASKSGIVKRFLVGRSFVTSKPEPNDFDCILVYDPEIHTRELLPTEYNLISRPDAHRMFGGDVIAVAEDSTSYHKYVEFFQRTRDGLPVGLVEIQV